MIKLTDLWETREVIPEEVQIIFQDLKNPTVNEVMSSWKLKTYTWDGWGIDNLNAGMSINFFCEFPCSTCSLTQNDLCYSCYTNSASKWIHFFENKCLDNCPNGYFNAFTNLTETGPDTWTCSECAPPCMTCGQNMTDCLTCLPGSLLYDVDHTCY
jgi:hypothetical protein